MQNVGWADIFSTKHWGLVSWRLMEVDCVLFRESLSAQLELTTTKAESEQLARQIAEEGVSRGNRSEILLMGHVGRGWLKCGTIARGYYH